MIYDNLYTFRHLRYPYISISSPNYIVIITNVVTNKNYVYGANILPNDNELNNYLLVKRVFENEGEDLSFTDYNPDNYQIKIINRKKKTNE